MFSRQQEVLEAEERVRSFREKESESWELILKQRAQGAKERERGEEKSLTRTIPQKLFFPSPLSPWRKLQDKKSEEDENPHTGLHLIFISTPVFTNFSLDTSAHFLWINVDPSLWIYL